MLAAHFCCSSYSSSSLFSEPREHAISVQPLGWAWQMCKRLVSFSMVAGSYKLSKAYIPVAILFFPRKRRLYVAHLKKWSSFTICHWCSSHLIGAMESIFTSISKMSKKLIMLKWAYSCLAEIISGRLLQFTAVYIHVTTMRHWCVKWCGPLTHCWNTYICTGGIPYISKSLK